MRYQSTRGEDRGADFSDILLGGLAHDGGLYIPKSWPKFSPEDWRSLRGLPYPELAARVIAPFAESAISYATLKRLCDKAYEGFDHPAITPLVEIGDGAFILELFHGPTLAFKDMAMQLLGVLFEHVLKERKQHATIIGATSGDTGSAAIEAFRGREHISVIILHPKGRTSEVQRRQMTTVLDENIHNIAIEGTFDDCQDLVKAMFADEALRAELALSAVNSINWARIAAQVPYYVRAGLSLGAPDRSISFAVPTGNFGNVLAAWVAKQMGLPIKALCIGSNRNDILTRFLSANDMSIRPVEPSLSPSMDIQISSNFERLLYASLDNDASACRDIVNDFRKTGHMRVSDAHWQKIRHEISGLTLSDAQTLKVMDAMFRQSGYLADPHTAIGYAAARAYQQASEPMVAVATAHPAKFPDAVIRATGVVPQLPRHLTGLMDRQERYETLPNDANAVKQALRRHARRA